MVGTVRPVVHGQAAPRFSARPLAFLVGSAGGGLVAFAGISILLHAAEAFLLVLGVLCAILAAGRCLTARCLRPQSLARQVRPRWGPSVHAWWVPAVWGAELGAGLTTRVSSWTYWSAAFFAAALPPEVAAASGAAFGSVRGLQPMLFTGSIPDCRARLLRLQAIASTRLVCIGPALSALALGTALSLAHGQLLP